MVLELHWMTSFPTTISHGFPVCWLRKWSYSNNNSLNHPLNGSAFALKTQQESKTFHRIPFSVLRLIQTIFLYLTLVWDITCVHGGPSTQLRVPHFGKSRIQRVRKVCVPEAVGKPSGNKCSASHWVLGVGRHVEELWGAGERETHWRGWKGEFVTRTWVGLCEWRGGRDMMRWETDQTKASNKSFILSCVDPESGTV